MGLRGWISPIAPFPRSARIRCLRRTDSLRVPAASVVALLLLAGGSGLRAQVSPDGTEFQVNDVTTGAQYDVRVATDGAGGFIVVWQSASSAGDDDGTWSVQARRFDRIGRALGPQFQVNTYTTGDQTHPAVAMNAEGSFAIVWSSDGSGASDHDLTSIQCRLYDGSGSPLTGQFQVNSATTGEQKRPAIAMSLARSFLVVWASDSSNGTDHDLSSIQAQRFGAAGEFAGSEFQVNEVTTSFQTHPDVAIDAGSDPVIVWQSGASTGGDTLGASIQARRLTAGLGNLGPEFQVNSYTTGSQGLPRVARAATGGFLVIWESESSAGPDASHSIEARRFDADGLPGTQFQVNTVGTGYQSNAELAMNPAGDAVVVWQSHWSATDTSLLSVQAQRYLAEGGALGPQFEVNTLTTGYQAFPDVALDPAGNFVVVWESDVSSGDDDDVPSLQARLYDDLFRDGFESGSWARWTAVSTP